MVSNHTSLDGSAQASWSTGTTYTISVTTANAGDLIVIGVQSNSQPVQTVADTAGLSWTQIGTITNTMQMFYAYSSGALTGDVVTFNYSVAPAFSTAVAFGISGVPSSSQLDSNVALPGTTTTSGTPFTLTTSNANDFLFGCYALSSNTAVTAGSGWTQIRAESNFMFCEYQIVTAPQSALTANMSSNTVIKNGKGHAAKSL